jgi:hypothetical protein
LRIDQQRAIDRYTVNIATDKGCQLIRGLGNKLEFKYLTGTSCLKMRALQHVGKELCGSVMISPKFHTEMADKKGIEYC